MRQLLVLFLCRCPATGTVAGIFWQLDTVEALSKPGPWSTKTWHTQTKLFLKGSIRLQERALGMRATLGLGTYHNAAYIAAIYEEMPISKKIALLMKMLKVKVDI